jgi:hypothetical protein
MTMEETRGSVVVKALGYDLNLGCLHPDACVKSVASRVIPANIFLHEDGRTTEPCSSLSSIK